MFDFARELKRLFGSEAMRPFTDGLTGGDAGLMELLDLRLLTQEGKSADIAAGRISAKDKAQRRLEAAVVWREAAAPATRSCCARPPPQPRSPPPPSIASAGPTAGPEPAVNRPFAPCWAPSCSATKA